VPEAVFGLPLHPLVVHATVVIVPATALVLALSLVLRRFRAWAGLLPLAMAAASAVLAPLSTSTGEGLEHMVGDSQLVRRHAELGGMLVWWCLAMLVVAAASWWVRRSRPQLSRGLATGLVVLGLVASLGTIVQTVLIGHSGAKAAWSGVVSSSPSLTLVLNRP
jgi:glucan phosphoethanolaminetransferase (alkaline phosphatase superfamily)